LQVILQSAGKYWESQHVEGSGELVPAHATIDGSRQSAEAFMSEWRRDRICWCRAWVNDNSRAAHFFPCYVQLWTGAATISTFRWSERSQICPESKLFDLLESILSSLSNETFSVFCNYFIDCFLLHSKRIARSKTRFLAHRLIRAISRSVTF
jgi:hypothetical protein